MGSDSICGDPKCGESFVCWADYQRLVQGQQPEAAGADGNTDEDESSESSESIGTELCDACQHLDLSPNSSNRSIDHLPDEIRQQIGETGSCPFCRLFKDIEFWNLPLDWNETSGFCVQRALDGSVHAQDGDSERIVFINPGSATAPHEFGRVVKPKADVSLFKRWLRLCETVHQEECAPVSEIFYPKNPRGLKAFRLIDVKDMCLVDAKPGCRYLTLSYMWGRLKSPELNKGNKSKLMISNSFKKILSSIPRTIRDAIDLVRRMGERYLWVDRFCLVQDDRSDMQHGIARMDLIYEGAVLCIIAAAGNSGNAGLPGIRRDSAREQRIEEVVPGVRMTTTSLFYNELNGQDYMTRGWTSLVFLDSMAYYRCCHVVWSEDTIYDNFPSLTHPHTGKSQNVSVLRKVIAEEGSPNYSSLLMRYNKRNLTDESDAVDAFMGILQRIASTIGSEIFLGLMTSTFDICMLFMHTTTNTAVRRPMFPSWSWAGWKGYTNNWVPERDGFDGNEWLAKNTRIVWYRRSVGTGKLELVVDPTGYRPDMATGLDLQTQPTDIPWGDILPVQYDVLQFWTWTIMIPTLKWPGRGFVTVVNCDGVECGSVYLDDNDYGKDKTRTYEAALLSTAEHCDLGKTWLSVPADQPIYYVILIEWMGIYAERRGMGYVHQSQIEYFLPPGRVWKEVVLA
ncbi:hypothetical protein FE257_004536 [Aspergillus nanangensis]|uniref:Heterokaryon incompatibility domain-containing protein n=1 Tax=Aspergillus nanangensis TaxID=2582783 RepID=A0AAD4GYH3_ASPNN|nr:hypothetical protein FE257_004536 [Aspergillus nanangensis]